MITVKIPTPLQKLTYRNAIVHLEGSSVREVLDSLCETYDDLGNRLFDNDGHVRRFLNVYVNNEDIRFLDNLDTKLKDDYVVSIVPAIAGGAQVLNAQKKKMAEDEVEPRWETFVTEQDCKYLANSYCITIFRGQLAKDFPCTQEFVIKDLEGQMFKVIRKDKIVAVEGLNGVGLGNFCTLEKCELDMHDPAVSKKYRQGHPTATVHFCSKEIDDDGKVRTKNVRHEQDFSAYKPDETYDVFDMTTKHCSYYLPKN